MATINGSTVLSAIWYLVSACIAFIADIYLLICMGWKPQSLASHIMFLHSYSAKHAVTCIQHKQLPQTNCLSIRLSGCQLCLAAFSYWKSLKWQTRAPPNPRRQPVERVLCGNFGSLTFANERLWKKKWAERILILIDMGWSWSSAQQHPPPAFPWMLLA